MPVRDFEKRLRRAEGRLRYRRVASLDAFTRMKIVLVAYHLGEMKPHESVMDGYSRALGYARSADLLQAWRNDDPEPGERHVAAMKRLCALRDYDPEDRDDQDPDETLKAHLEALIDETPPELLWRMSLVPCDIDDLFV
jgi:hypothetical protein